MKDLRDFIATCEKEGELRRVKAEVDWDLELSHICKVVEEKAGPALLFENVKGYKSPVLTGAFATTKRLAIILGRSTNLSMVELTKEWVDVATKSVVPAKEVKDGPIFENIVDGDKVDTFAFPSPKFYELDGGRYFGTAVFMTIQDPDTGDINLGTYRMGVLDNKTVGVQILKGKKGDRILKKYGKKGKKMPACAIIGGDPLHIFAGAATVPGAKSGYDVVGTLRGSPVEVVKGQLSGLPIPAAAEIVLEGEIDAEQTEKRRALRRVYGLLHGRAHQAYSQTCPGGQARLLQKQSHPLGNERGQAGGGPAHALCLCAECQLVDGPDQDADPRHQVGVHHAGSLRDASGWSSLCSRCIRVTRTRWPQRSLPATQALTGSRVSLLWTTISVQTISRGCGGRLARGTTRPAAHRLSTEAGPPPSILPLGRMKTSSSPHGSSWMRRSPLTGRSNPRRSSSRRASWPK